MLGTSGAFKSAQEILSLTFPHLGNFLEKIFEKTDLIVSKIKSIVSPPTLAGNPMRNSNRLTSHSGHTSISFLSPLQPWKVISQLFQICNRFEKDTFFPPSSPLVKLSPLVVAE